MTQTPLIMSSYVRNSCFSLKFTPPPTHTHIFFRVHPPTRISWIFCLFVCCCFCCFNLHVKALLKALVYMMLWLNYNVMDMVNVVMFYLVTISDTTNEILPGENKIY